MIADNGFFSFGTLEKVNDSFLFSCFFSYSICSATFAWKMTEKEAASSSSFLSSRYIPHYAVNQQKLINNKSSLDCALFCCKAHKKLLESGMVGWYGIMTFAYISSALNLGTRTCKSKHTISGFDYMFHELLYATQRYHDRLTTGNDSNWQGMIAETIIDYHQLSWPMILTGKIHHHYRGD